MPHLLTLSELAVRWHARRCRKLSEQAFELVKHVLPPHIAERIRADICDYNEWGLGVETLVDTLLEADIAVSRRQKAAIVKAMDTMGLDRHQADIEIAE